MRRVAVITGRWRRLQGPVQYIPVIGVDALKPLARGPQRADAVINANAPAPTAALDLYLSGKVLHTQRHLYAVLVSVEGGQGEQQTRGAAALIAGSPQPASQIVLRRDHPSSLASIMAWRAK